jgi:5-methylcytosine-specific restriction endonuclease McrA
VCKHCGTEIIGRRSVCDACLRRDWSKLTLATVGGEARYQIHAVVRRHARMTYAESERPKQCINCGYNKHYEVCHIRPITDFPLDTTIGAINALSNLVALCPNCHWEFDHNMLSLEEIRAKNNASF